MTAWRAPFGAGSFFALGLVLTHDAIAPGAVRAQDTFRLRPSFGTTEVYDSNLFFTSVNRQADFVTRVTPGVESEYRSTVWNFNGSYTFDVERFAEHRELTSTQARRHAMAGIEYRPTRRLTLATDGELSRTQTPGELNMLTGLAFTRATAQRVASHSSITHNLDRVNTATIDYTFLEDRLAGGIMIRTHTAMAGTDHHVTARDTVKIDYSVRQFLFGTSSATSHLLGLEWTRAITRRASVSIGGGPRVTNGSLAPDLSASVRYRLRPGELSLGFARTQTTVLGLAGIADTQSVTAAANWGEPRSLQLRVSPAVFRTTLDSRQADVYQLAIALTHRIVNGISLEVATDASVQHGSLYAAPVNDTIPRQDIVIRLIAAPAPRRRAQ